MSPSFQKRCICAPDVEFDQRDDGNTPTDIPLAEVVMVPQMPQQELLLLV
jgi:hypothetical protein